MPFLNRLGLRRGKSPRTAPPTEASDGEVDLTDFDTFKQSDMGIASKGRPTSSFSKRSAYTLVDSPRLTIEDSLSRAPRTSTDRRRPDVHYTVSMNPTEDRQRQNRVMFSSEPELRRIPGGRSLHRRYRAQNASTLDLNNNQELREKNYASPNVDAPEEQDKFGSGESPGRPRSLPEDETPDRSRLGISFDDVHSNNSQLSLSFRLPGLIPTEPETMAYEHRPTFDGSSTVPTEEESAASASSDPKCHVCINAEVPPFQRVAGHKHEPSKKPNMRSNTRRNELPSIPSRPSGIIARHPDPPRTTHPEKSTQMSNRVPEPTLLRSLELTFMRATSSLVDAQIQKEEPKFKQERMLNAASKRGSFWGSVNRVGDNKPKNTSQDTNDEKFDNEARTAAYRSIESAEQQKRAIILDRHLGKILQASRGDIKLKSGGERRVQVTDGRMRRVRSKRGLIGDVQEVLTSTTSVEDECEQQEEKKKAYVVEDDFERVILERFRAIRVRFSERYARTVTERGRN